MKILVTGAGGLLGGRIISFLSQKGHNIVAVSRSYAGCEAWDASVKVVNIDISKTSDLCYYLDGVSLVIHTAGINAAHSIADPVNALHFNGVVTAKLLNESIKCDVDRFIYISTVQVYSNELKGIINENSCTRNLHPYATSHKAGEDVTLFANAKNKIQGTVIRLSNSFGYPVNKNADCWHLLINDLCKQAVSKGSLDLNSSGNQFRNFITINEICKSIDFLINERENSREYPVINLASKNTITVISMAKLVQERAQIFLKKKIPLFTKDDELNLVYSAFSLQTLSLNQLSYSVSDNLADEIDKLLEYCNEMFNK